MTSAAVAVCALGLGLAACGAAQNTNKTKLDLVIGASLPLSGDLEAYGPSGQKAAEMAISEIEDAIKDSDADHTVKLVTEDNGGGSDPATASAAAKKLSDQDADCITGAWASEDTITSAEEVAIPDGIPLISPASTSDEISALDDDDLVSRTVPPDVYQGGALAEAIEKDLGDEAKGAVVNIGARNDAYGTGLADDFTQAWEDKGGEVGDTVIYEPGKVSSADAVKITAGKPDATLIIDYPASFSQLGPALARTGEWDPKTAWGSDGLAFAGITNQSAGFVDGMRVTSPAPPKDDDTTDAFDKLFAGSDPKDVDAQEFAAQTFDSVILCYLGAVYAGSTDGTEIAQALLDVSGPGGDSFTYEKLSDAIDKLQDDEDIDYDGVSGEIDMDKAGDPTEGTYDVSTFSKGELVPGEQIEANGD